MIAEPLSKSLTENPSEWSDYLRHKSDSNESIPASFHTLLRQHGVSSSFVKIAGLILVKELKRDLFISVATRFIEVTFNREFFPEELDFAASLAHDINPKYPILLCSKPGYDASTKVDALAEAENIRNYNPIAIGSKEGFDTAEKAIDLGTLIP
jgi:dynein heavy chain 1